MEDIQWWAPYAPWVWIMPFLIIILIITLATCIRQCTGDRRWAPWYNAWCKPSCWLKVGQGPMTRSWTMSSQQILDQRYASGEITREQYETMKRTIESHYCPGDEA